MATLDECISDDGSFYTAYAPPYTGRVLSVPARLEAVVGHFRGSLPRGVVGHFPAGAPVRSIRRNVVLGSQYAMLGSRLLPLAGRGGVPWSPAWCPCGRMGLPKLGNRFRLDRLDFYGQVCWFQLQIGLVLGLLFGSGLPYNFIVAFVRMNAKL